MRIENVELTAIVLDANANSEPLWVGTSFVASLQIVSTGTAPTGTFKVQASCDPGQPNAQAKTQQSADVTNWSDVANATAAITAAGTSRIDLSDMGYTWVRVVWTSTSGTGSATIRASLKG